MIMIRVIDKSYDKSYFIFCQLLNQPRQSESSVLNVAFQLCMFSQNRIGQNHHEGGISITVFFL